MEKENLEEKEDIRNKELMRIRKEQDERNRKKELIHYTNHRPKKGKSEKQVVPSPTEPQDGTDLPNKDSKDKHNKFWGF